MFANQIALSGSPFPTLSNPAGQIGEISTGITLFILLCIGRRLSPAAEDGAFFIANFGIAIIMLVAIYVHLHPNVPAETLSLGTKPLYLTVVILLLVCLSMYLRRTNQRTTIFTASTHEAGLNNATN